MRLGDKYMRNIEYKKYLYAFIISGAIFLTALYISNTLNNKRLTQIKSIQDAIATDILSSETQFSLLSELSCNEVSKSLLSSELNNLAEKIEYSEKNIGENKDVVQLKKFYSLLEIKDYLLMRRVAERCGKKFMFALYFYADKKTCPDCEKTGYTLTYLREKYPDLRVYSFDYNLDVSAVETLITVFDIKSELPALLIGNQSINGYKEKEDLEKILKTQYPKETREAIEKAKTATSTDTKTK